MINRQQILTTAAAITLLTIGGLAAASDNVKAYASEVKTCVAEVRDHANYEGATRVLHTFVITRRTGRGYVFTIDTSVYTKSDDTAVREYASYCFVRGDDRLVKFRIDEVSA